jgi:hypothetical protein
MNFADLSRTKSGGKIAGRSRSPPVQLLAQRQNCECKYRKINTKSRSLRFRHCAVARDPKSI